MYPFLKLVTVFFWLGFAYNFFFPLPEPFTNVVAWVGIILAITHTLEYAFKKSALEAINAGGLHGYCQTLLFGFLYWYPLLKK